MVYAVSATTIHRKSLALFCVFLLGSPSAFADCSPDEFRIGGLSLPTSDSTVVCSGNDTDGFRRPRDETNPSNDRDQLTVIVTGTVSSNLANAVLLEGDSHTLIVSGDGVIAGDVRIAGFAPSFTLLDNATVGNLTGIGDNAFLNVSGLSGAESITLEGSNATAMLTGGQIGALTLQGADASLTMDGALIGGGLEVNGDRAAVTIASGVSSRVGVFGAGASLTIDGGAFNDVVRIEGVDATGTIHAGSILGRVVISGERAILDNSVTIAGGVIVGNDARVDNRGSIEGSGVFLLDAGGTLNNRGMVRTVSPDTEAVLALSRSRIVNSNVIKTTGNGADAISLDGDASTVTNENGKTISTSGADASAIFVDGNDTYVVNDGTVQTDGPRSFGISVDGSFSPGGASGEPVDDDLRNGVGAHIVTRGLRSLAMFADGRNAQLGNAGRITTEGDFSIGMGVLGANHFMRTVILSSIETNGDNAAAIQSGLANPSLATSGVEIRHAGDIVTRGEFSHGIASFGPNEAIVTEGTSTITTERFGAAGIHVESTSGLPRLFTAGTLTTRGENAPGIRLVGNGARLGPLTDEISSRSGKITTSGDFSDGIFLEGNNALFNEFHEIVTHGEASDGIAIEGNSNDVGRLFETSIIRTYGARADGVAIGDENSASPATSNVLRIASPGIGEERVDTAIITSGNDADGIRVVGNANAVFTGIRSSPTDPDTSKALTISVQGLDSDAVELNGVDNDLTNNAVIEALGQNGTGVRLSGHSQDLENYGRIEASGTGGVAIRLFHHTGDSELLFSTRVRNEKHAVLRAPVNAIVADAATSVLLTNSGTIDGNVTLGANTAFGDFGDQFVGGTGSRVNGHVSLGGGPDTAVLFGSEVIAGDLSLGAGDDRLEMDSGRSVVGSIDGGIGEDVIAIDVAAFETDGISGWQIANFEVLEKRGDGLLLFAGEFFLEEADILLGTVELDAGTALNTSGDTINVEAGATLAGLGTAGGRVVVNGGTIAPGSNGVGTLTIDGDLDVLAGMLDFEVTSDSAFDALRISGNAVLNGGFVNVRLGIQPDPSTVLDMLSVDGTLTVLPGFEGVIGIATPGAGALVGDPFRVRLGGEVFVGTIASVVPVPPALWLLVSALALMGARADRTKSDHGARPCNVNGVS